MPRPRNRILTTLVAAASMLYVGSAMADSQNWQIHSDIDLFAFSEAVSIEQFAKDFDDDLVSGETAFTHGKFEIGVRYGPWRFAYLDRFDYITEFTEDTAFYHHSASNGNLVPTDRRYHLLLDVERVHAQGVSLGYTWQVNDRLSVDIAGNYYFNARQLQSGFAEAEGDLEPIDDELIAEFNRIRDNLVDSNDRDLSPLNALASEVHLNLEIDYAYDEPKFGEKQYRKPVIVGDPNPPLSGVSFDEPGGKGYSFDIGINWQVTDQLNLQADFIDIGHTITWDDAARTQLSFGLNAALFDVIDVAQDFVNGEVIRPNDIVDRHLLVEIANEDYDQHLPWRANLLATWLTEVELDLLGWKPGLAVLGGYYHTEAKAFPRLGIGLNGLKLYYDFGGEAIYLIYEGRYGFAKIVADDFDTKQAHLLGISLGLQYAF